MVGVRTLVTLHVLDAQVSFSAVDKSEVVLVRVGCLHQSLQAVGTLFACAAFPLHAEGRVVSIIGFEQLS